jgi:hypothetical protein
MSAQRTDPHRPGEIIPTDYDYLFSYERPAMQHGYAGYFGGWGRGFVEGLRAFNEKAANWFSRRPGHCDICGARFNHGDVWFHRPTGVHINVGHDCADKYAMLANRSEWEAWHRVEKDRRAVAIRERKHAAERDKRIADHAGVIGRFNSLINHPNASVFARNFSADTRDKLITKGYLPSEKQFALLTKLEGEAEQPPPPVEVHVPTPTGRVQFTGVVVGLKVQDGDWGSSLKATVKVSTDGGVWLAWITVPPSVAAIERGDQVTVKATLTHGKDDYFAFGKRPVFVEVTR